jgi:nucleoside-diphosphate-sugar epimerase
VKILITGAGGFLGKKLKTYLAPRYEVDAFTRSEFDLTDLEQVCDQLSRPRYDVIVHCAAQGRNNLFSTDLSIVANNLEAFSNLLVYRKQFGKLINISSGAEFDLSQNIYRALEQEIWSRFPAHSYGRSKNLIARQVTETASFQNLRLFGCFDSDEDEKRLLKRATYCLSTDQPFTINDNKEFDMVSFRDFAHVVEMACLDRVVSSDVNVVYPQKYRLSEILNLYCSIKGFDNKLIKVTGTATNNYSGNGYLLSKYNLDLEELETAFKNYIIKG